MTCFKFSVDLVDLFSQHMKEIDLSFFKAQAIRSGRPQIITRSNEINIPENLSLVLEETKVKLGRMRTKSNTQLSLQNMKQGGHMLEGYLLSSKYHNLLQTNHNPRLQICSSLPFYFWGFKKRDACRGQIYLVRL